MNKFEIMKRMREDNIKWDKIGYYLGTTGNAAKKEFKRKRDIEELGEKPIIKRSKFETPIHLRIKQLARDNPKLAIRDFEALLREEFPDKDIPKKPLFTKS
jgi:hypothetical protein